MAYQKPQVETRQALKALLADQISPPTDFCSTCP
jgi:hypothetical protein